MSLIKKPSELEVQPYIKALLYGQPGVRKTTLALSAPAPLLIDADRGVHRVDSRHQTDTVQVKSWEDVQNVLQEDLSAYKTLVIDTAGKLLDFMAAYLMQQDPKLRKGDGSLTLQGYGARKVMFQNFLKQVALMGKHLVFVAHEKEEKDGEEKVLRPEIGGSSSGDLIKDLDLVGYMQSIGNRKTISFEPTQRFYGKNTCKLPASIDLRQTLNEDGSTVLAPNNQLAGIFDTYQKSLEERKKTTVDYGELLNVIGAKVEEIATAADANEVSEWAAAFDGHIWDSKLQAAYAIRDRAKELGLIINKESKKYEDPAPPAGSDQNNNATGNNGAPAGVPPATGTGSKTRNRNSKSTNNATTQQGELIS